MKRIKIVIISIVVLTCVMVPIACNKSFLNQTNTFGISPDAAASKPQQVISLVNAIYDTYQNSDLLKKCIWYRANFGTHDFFNCCLLYTSDAADERSSVDIGGRR